MRLSRILSSSLGRKYLVAASGIGLVLFLVVHLAGNLTLYADAEGKTFDGYAHALEANPLLPFAEIGLLGVLVLHVALAIQVTRQNRDARPAGYAARAPLDRSTPASRSMIVTGVLVLLFLCVHLWDFRAQTLFGPWDDGTLAGMVKKRLASPAGMLIYSAGSIAVGIHLSHGVRSALQSFGIHHPRYQGFLRSAGLVLAVGLALGFLSFPVVIFFLWK